MENSKNYKNNPRKKYWECPDCKSFNGFHVNSCDCGYVANEKVKSSSSEEIPEIVELEILRTLKNINNKLKDPNLPKKESIFSAISNKIRWSLKFIGLPALILASIIPVYELLKEYRTKALNDLLLEVYIAYSQTLIDEGNSERAVSLLDSLKKSERLDPRAQYIKAEALASLAIKSGKQIEKAEDTINVLLRLNKKGNLITGNYGKYEDKFRLTLMLVDIDLAISRYESAKKRLEKIDKNELKSFKNIEIDYYLKKGTLNVFQANIKEAKNNLTIALRKAEASNPQHPKFVEILFQMAKSFQFEGKSKEAIEEYKRASDLFFKNKDKRGISRCHNNIGMILYNDNRVEEAIEHYRITERISREINDDIGLARVLFNLGGIEAKKGNFQKTVELNLEALGAFEKINHRDGIAHSQASLGSNYWKLNQLDKAFFYSKKAFNSFIKLKEINRIGGTAGILADLAKTIGNDEKFAIYDFVAAVFRKASNDIRWETNVRLFKIQKAHIDEKQYADYLNQGKEFAKKIVLELNRADVTEALVEDISSKILDSDTP